MLGREPEFRGLAEAGHVAEFFDAGQSRTVAWARSPDRGWDAIVIGEYERAF